MTIVIRFRLGNIKWATIPVPLTRFDSLREPRHIVYIILMLHTGKIFINLQQSALMYIQQNNVTEIWDDVFEIFDGVTNTGYSC